MKWERKAMLTVKTTKIVVKIIIVVMRHSAKCANMM